MKHKFLILLISGIILTDIVQAQNVQLKGKLDGFQQYPVGIIVNRVDDKNKFIPIDTIYTNDKGAYNAVIDVSQPTMYILTFTAMQRSSLIHFLAMPNEKVTMDLEYKPEENYVILTRVGGSDNMSAYQRFNTAMYRPLRVAREIGKEYTDSNTTAERKQVLQQNYEKIYLQQRNDIKKVVEKNRNHLISAFLVTYFDDDFATYADLYTEVRDALIERYPSNPFVQYIDQKVKSSLAAGTLAPEISMKNPNGEIIALSSLRGKVVLVDFWASWCRPCRMANPEVVRLYQKYKDQGFDIFSVSLDNDRNAWLSAIASDGLSWPNHVSDLTGWKSSGGAAYGVVSVPTTVLIDREGRIIAKNLHGQELEQKLQEIFVK